MKKSQSLKYNLRLMTIPRLGKGECKIFKQESTGCTGTIAKMIKMILAY